ncbi:glycosyltransferase family 2 protein [Tropicimonas sp. IMCC6043]|uniref:glycosyltransferase family 2 protein n=1 Tax=Tropicimonas sp. IMCC6043 TaxID=2510645 RepID=UPI0013ED3FF8|nr:glycosyltransferase family 2 protein [Tropicimonas sp. IMCC6043]
MSFRKSQVAVIVVNYGTAELALDAVGSVISHDHAGYVVEIHLVDNASPGDDAAVLATAIAERGWKDRVRFFPQTENHGFGRGNNLVLRTLAARRRPPDKVFLLNPDARLDNEAIAILARFLDANPEVGAAGPRISKPGNQPVSAAFRFPSLASEFDRSLGFGPVSRLLKNASVAFPPEQPAGQVDWVSGAAVMFRFEAIRGMDFFDPAYFLYYEELDLMWRLKRAGWTCWHLPEARIVHAEGTATGVRSHDIERSRRPTYWYDSRRIFSRKVWGRARGSLVAGAVMFGAAAHLVISALRRRTPGLPLHFLSDYWEGVFRPLLTGRDPAR